METLDRLGFEDAARAARFEEPVDGLHAELDDEGLVAAIPRAVPVGERLAARALVEDLADVGALERARRVHFGRRLGDAQLQRARLCVSTTRGELVDRALGHA